MILTLHVVVAILSLGLSTFMALRPSKDRLVVSYGSIGATALTGSLLIVLGYSVLHACIAGAIFVGSALVLTAIGHGRLLRGTTR